jgi:hypothetical protein
MKRKYTLKKIFGVGALILVSVSLFAGVLFMSPQKTEAQVKSTDAYALIPGIGPVISGYFRAKDAGVEAITDAALKPFWFMGYLIRMLLTFVLGVVGFIFGFIVDLNFKILDPASFTYTFITSGWTITRDVANLGFVLFIILIALATIVRYQDYEAKKLLPRLIAAAILVNFSIAIPTVILNFTHILGNYFLDGIGNPTQGLNGSLSDSGAMRLSTEIATILAPQGPLFDNLSTDDIAYLAGSNDVNDPVLKGASATVAMFGNIAFVLVTIFVLGTLAVLFVVRFIALHILFVLAPIVWLFWIIPSLQHTFSEWWKKFFQHAFFLPASIFFIYLVILTGKGLFKVSAGLDTSGFVAEGASQSLQVMMRWGAVNFVICGFLIGSIMVARSLSIKGADGAMRLGGDITSRARKWAGRKTADAGRAIGKGAIASQPGQKLAKRLAVLGQNSPLSGLTKPVNMLGRVLRKTGIDYTQELRKKAEGKLTGDTQVDAGFYNSLLGGGILQQEGNRIVLEKVTKEGGEFHKAVLDSKEEVDKSGKEERKAEEEYSSKRSYLENIEENDKPALEEVEKEISDLKAKVDDSTIVGKAKDDVKEKYKAAREEKSVILERIVGAEDAFREAEKKLQEVRTNKQKAEKKSSDAASNFNDFQASVLSQLPNDVRNSIKAADFKIESVVAKGDFNKTLDMGKSLKGVIPEKSLEKVKNELAKLNSRLSTARKDLEVKQKNPLESRQSIKESEDLVKQLSEKVNKTQGWVARRDSLDTELSKERSVAQVKISSGQVPKGSKEAKTLKSKLDKIEKEINRVEALSPVNKFMTSKPKKDEE